MPPAISRTSAIMQLADWIDVHGRGPTAAECRTKNGLNYYTTYVQFWGGISHAISLASMVILLGVSGVAVSVVTSLRPVVTRPCLRCGKMMRSRYINVRHCQICRRQLFTEAEDCELPGEIPPHIQRRYLTLETWDDLLDEAVIHCK